MPRFQSFRQTSPSKNLSENWSTPLCQKRVPTVLSIMQMVSCDDGSDLDESADEVQTPISRNKAKRKKTEGGSGSRSEKKKTSKV